MRKQIVLAGLVLAVAAIASSAHGASGARNASRVDPADFSNKIDNPYLPWRPGTVYRYRSSEPGTTNVVTVTHKTKKILGVECVVVRDLDKVDGKPDGRSLDWYAQDKVGNVWYFGERTSRYTHGHWVVDPADSWKSGVRGARPGILMEAHPRMGDIYRQEIARRDNALDTSKVLGYEGALTVPYGTFHHVLKTKEFSPLEPGHIDHDLYARGIGELKEVNVKGGEGKSVLVSVSH